MVAALRFDDLAGLGVFVAFQRAAALRRDWRPVFTPGSWIGCGLEISLPISQ